MSTWFPECIAAGHLYLGRISDCKSVSNWDISQGLLSFQLPNLILFMYKNVVILQESKMEGGGVYILFKIFNQYYNIWARN